jgi:hypothetical protein
VRTFDSHARDGVRRALALGVAMFAFQTLATHNAFWVMLTVFVILGPAGRPSPLTAARRVVGTLAGVLAAVAVAQVLPWPAVLAISVAALALSLAASTRSTAVSAAFGAAAAAMLVALPSGDFLGHAAARLVDTVIGAAIAVVCGWLLWPGTSRLLGAGRPRRRRIDDGHQHDLRDTLVVGQFPPEVGHANQSGHRSGTERAGRPGASRRMLDPLEGSLAFVVGGALLLFAYATSRIQVPALAWVGWLVAVVAGAAAVGGAV